MSLRNSISSSVSENNELRKSQLAWLDDESMKKEVKKLSSELQSRSVVYDDEELDLCVTTEPTVKSDYQKETKDGYKEIEIDGRKYRQQYQRHIQLEKHTVKQIFTFSGDESSILDFDVQLNACTNSPKIENEIFFNINAKTILEDMKRVMSPKIVIRSTNQMPTKQDDLENHFHSDTCSQKIEISSFIDKFGQTDFSELAMDKKVLKDLHNLFISQWQKTENESGPEVQCKTISCVQRFKDLSKQGKLLHRSTCVQMTRSLIVRSKSGEDEIKSNVSEINNYPELFEKPLLYKINVSDDLVYNERYNPSLESTCKQFSIAAGHVDALLAHACSIGINTSADYHLFHNTFAITYSIIMTTEELLNKLVKRYTYFYNNVPNNNELVDYDLESSAVCVQRELMSAVINLMVQVIKYWSRPLTTTVENILYSFCVNLKEFGNLNHNLIIQGALKDLKERISMKEKRFSSIKNELHPRHIIDKTSLKTILDFDSRIVAEQLTLLESEIFDQLDLEDLLNFKSACNNPSLMKCVHFFNKLTFWIKTQLLLPDSDRPCSDREKRFNKFVEILKELKSHQNFSGYASILYSLIDFPEKFLSKKTRLKFTEECQFMNLSNKKLYLNAVQKANPPFIPLLAETFSHLTRLNEIMPTFITHKHLDKEHVNFKKMWQYLIIIQYFVVKMQLPPSIKYYQFQVDLEVLAFINNFDEALTETELFMYKEKLIRSKSKKLSPKQRLSTSDITSKDL